MGPLSVRIVDGAGNDRHVRFRGLRWRKTASGGWADLNVTAVTPLGAFTDLGPNDRIFVYDTASGRTVMEAFVDNPGGTRGPAGEEYELTATGPAGLMHDSARPYVVVDQNLDAWEPAGALTTKNAQSEKSEIDADTPTLEVRAREGATVSTNWRGDWVYRPIQRSGQSLARITITRQAGLQDANYLQRIFTQLNNGAETQAFSQFAITTTTTASVVVGTNFPLGNNVAHLRAMRANTSTTGAESHWFAFWNVVVRSLQVDRFGNNITVGYADHTFSHGIVADMIGRGMLPGVDPNNATIESGTFPITQFASYDGITGGGVLEMLAVFEPDFVYGYGQSTGAGHEFWYRRWDDDNPRYEVSERDGSIRPGSDNDLCNRVVVSWRDKRGRDRTTIVTASVPALGSRVRDADPVSLPDGYGTEANAQRLGQEILARRAEPSRAGQVVLRKPVMDLHEGRLVAPWEVEAGYPVRVRETGEVLRCTEINYDHDARTVVMTLGTPTFTPEELLAELTKRSSSTGRNVVPLRTQTKQNKGKRVRVTAQLIGPL